jgi:hypothetical protein
MELTPQAYPLWLAQVVDDEVQAGRIIAWIVGDLSPNTPDPVAQPIVVFADDDGFVWATMQASRTAVRFVGDSREATSGVAEQWVRERRDGSAGTDHRRARQ